MKLFMITVILRYLHYIYNIYISRLLKECFENQTMTTIGTYGNRTGVEDGPASHSGKPNKGDTTGTRHLLHTRK